MTAVSQILTTKIRSEDLGASLLGERRSLMCLLDAFLDAAVKRTSIASTGIYIK